ncbi:response regulator, partial [Clostridium thermobutyricum]|uniref:response regulator n=1 Tax=Clostridium thermobutyricum TaxID=29372 RepID=UPI003F51D423
DFLFSEGSFTGRDQALMPALIVLDLTLPKLSGIEVLKRIRESSITHSIPVVVLTADEDPAKVAQCYDLGANSFIRKPTDPSEFSEMVLQVAMYWLLL